MSKLILTPARMSEGIWEARLHREGGSGGIAPEIVVSHMERPLADVSVTPDPGHPDQWLLRVPVPLTALCDGVQTFLIHDRATETRIGAFSIAMGDALEGDIRAEIDLLRAELDMLKRAFRRHCVETSAG